MTFTKLVPNLYYTNINDGLKMFIDCLGFEMGHEELKSAEPFCVLHRDGLQFLLFQHEKLAKEHNPEFRLETENIEEVYKKVSASHPEFLHPLESLLGVGCWLFGGGKGKAASCERRAVRR